jgi:hypothetical protein
MICFKTSNISFIFDQFYYFYRKFTFHYLADRAALLYFIVPARGDNVIRIKLHCI